MSLYSSYLPAGAQFDDNAPWNPDHVERSEHEVECFVDSEPVAKPQIKQNKAWQQSLADTLKKEVI